MPGQRFLKAALLDNEVSSFLTRTSFYIIYEDASFVALCVMARLWTKKLKRYAYEEFIYNI